MARSKKKREDEGALVAVEPMEIQVLPPQSGVVGQFLTDTENMFKARGMRMKAFFRRINETGARMEGLLRMASQAMEAAEATLEDDFRKQGLLVDEPGEDEGVEESIE